MANIATLSVSVVAKTGAFLSGTEKVIRRVNRMERQFKRMIGTTGRLAGAFVALAGVGGMGALLKTSLATIDATAKMADRLGLTVQEAVALGHAAELAGANLATMEKGIQTMLRNVQDAADGTGLAVDALEKLGITAETLALQSSAQQFRTIADAIAGVGSQAEKVQIAYDLFGRSGVQLLNTMQAGSASIDRVTKSIALLGGTVDREGAAKVEMFNDAMSTFRLSIKLASDRITVSLAPAMERAANVMVGMSLQAEAIIAKVVSFAKGVGELVAAWVFFTRIVPKVVSGLKLVGAAAAAAINVATLGGGQLIKVILKIVGSIAAMAAAWWGANEVFDAALEDAQKAFDEFENAGKAARNLAQDIEVPTKAFESMKWAAADVVKQTKKIGDVTQKVTQEVKTSPISPIANQPRFTGAVAAGSQEAIRLIAQNRNRGDNLQREILLEERSQTKLLELIGRKVGGGGGSTINNTVVSF